ncbi:hypothetical protein K461DRAFT_324687 [Myriangium duriaei CBS 260.36]|uniref:Cytochrome b561 domain-containing protein n=1 Tax=Myriangium duriaei CBS 260.36 TaxID=1168546 RepID=A0A9P4ITP8_9PEZI|nr:hypothetical protein K461DRAFT_324687 [Myriangium duriaei CBS 260.36]
MVINREPFCFLVVAFAALATTTSAQGFGNGGFGGFGGSNGGSNGFGGNGSGGFGGSFAEEMKFRLRILLAHGVCMALAFAFMMPLGGAMMRLLKVRGGVWIHGVWQTVAYLLALAGFGMGVWMARERRMLTHAHPIIGIIVIAVLFFQPLGGLIAHLRFKSVGRNFAGLCHRWTGRIFITLGVINGGLGIQLARASSRWVVGYSVTAAIFVSLWWAVSLVDWYRDRRHAVGAPRIKRYSEFDG